MANKIIKIPANKQIIKDADYITTLEKKAAFLDELVSFFEDRAFGSLMEQTEPESDISLEEAKELMARPGK